jgi:hypothetical protein
MSNKKQLIWKNRIVGLGSKPAKEFKFNPLNWRTHPEFQRQTLNGILSEVGWVTGVIENVTTGHLLDGHARIEEALAKDENEIVPFIQVKLTEEEERKILAVLDPIGAMATSDDEKLKELSSILEFESEALTELMSCRQTSDVNLNEFFEQITGEKKEVKEKIILEYSVEEYELVSKELLKHGTSYEQAVWNLLGL